MITLIYIVLICCCLSVGGEYAIVPILLISFAYFGIINEAIKSTRKTNNTTKPKTRGRSIDDYVNEFGEIKYEPLFKHDDKNSKK